MSLIDDLRKGRGRQLSGSVSAQRRRLSLRSNPRLPADRIAAALGTLPIAPSVEARSQSTSRVEKRASGVRAPKVRTMVGAPDGPAPVVVPPVVQRRGVARSSASASLASDGRHRAAGEQLAGWPPPPASAAAPPRHGRDQGNAPGETGPVGSAHRRPQPGPPESGRHRRTAPPKRAMVIMPTALLAAGAKSHRLVVLGVVVLLVAVALVFGVRVAMARPSAQPELVATTAQGQPGGETSGALRPPSRSGVR